MSQISKYLEGVQTPPYRQINLNFNVFLFFILWKSMMGVVTNSCFICFNSMTDLAIWMWFRGIVLILEVKLVISWVMCQILNTWKVDNQGPLTNLKLHGAILMKSMMGVLTNWCFICFSYVMDPDIWMGTRGIVLIIWVEILISWVWYQNLKI